MNNPPMPNTCHPSLEYLADFVRSCTDRDVLRYVKPSRPLVALWSDGVDLPIQDVASEVATLTRKKCAGPAPYVGRPFAYMWWAWVTDDGTNRAVTSDSELAYTMTEFEWMARRKET